MGKAVTMFGDQVRGLPCFKLQQLPLNAGSPSMVLVPREWTQIAIKLARHGNNSHLLSLFHQGMDLPRWLMKVTKQSGFYF